MCFNIHTRAPANNSNYIAKCTFLRDKCDVSIKLDLFPPLVEPEMYIHVYSENSFVKILNSVTKSLLTMKCDLERARSVIQSFLSWNEKFFPVEYNSRNFWFQLLLRVLERRTRKGKIDFRNRTRPNYQKHFQKIISLLYPWRWI